MTRPFLITGFPRCRTAWLSALANTVPGAICRHEPTAERPWRETLSLLREPEFAYAGISDSAMGFHLGEILHGAAFPVLIVTRDPGEVEASLAGLGIYGDMQRFCRVLLDCMEPYRRHPSVRWIDHGELDDGATVTSCLRHLMPGAAIRPAKIAEMQHMNVQADMQRVFRLANARAETVAVDTFGARVAALLA